MSLTARNHVDRRIHNETACQIFLTHCHEKMTYLIFRTTREKRIPLGRWDPPTVTRPSGWNVYFYIVEKKLATPDPAKTGNV